MSDYRTFVRTPRPLWHHFASRGDRESSHGAILIPDGTSIVVHCRFL